MAAGVAGVLPEDWLPRLWKWMDASIGAAVQNGMLDANHVTEFQQIKITDVGINRDTPQLLLDLLIRHNNQRRVPLTPMKSRLQTSCGPWGDPGASSKSQF